MAGPSAQLCTISGGGFQDSAGNAIALGKITCRLQQDIVLAGTQICAGRTVTLSLDSSGDVTGSPTLWGAASYIAKAYDAAGSLVWSGTISVPNEESYSLTPGGGGPPSS